MIQPDTTLAPRLGNMDGIAPTGIDLPDPKTVIAFQSQCASALMEVVNQQKGPKNPFKANIQGKDFLTFESWQTIARLNGCDILVNSTEPIMENEKIIAYDTWCSVVDRRTGQVVSRANMECGMSAFPTQGKEGREKHKAAKSASQTWAGAKACRMAFSFVAVLAGFEATTAEEMMGGGALATDSMVLCPFHDLEWFKRGRMPKFAHTIEGAKGPKGGAVWCNQEDVEAQLSDRMKAIARAEVWDAAKVTDWGDRWSGMTPSAKLEALTGLENPDNVDTETGEIIDEGQESFAGMPDEEEPTPEDH